MCNTEEMVKLLKQRPGMYLGTRNTNTKELYIYLYGFNSGRFRIGMGTELDKSFHGNFAGYMFDWLDKNNKLNNLEFHFEWFRLLDSFGEEGISLFYIICEEFFSEYHSHNSKDFHICINNSTVRWCLSSQEIWIGDKKNHEEIDEEDEKMYSRFISLCASESNLFFDRYNFQFTMGFIKFNEPVRIIEENLEFLNIKNVDETFKLTVKEDLHLKLAKSTRYYSKEDELVSYSDNLKLDDETIIIEITKDFSFIVKDKDLLGWILKNASIHLVDDEMNFIDSNTYSTQCIKETLKQYLTLVERLKEELESDAEEKLINDFKTLYERIKASTESPLIAIKENIVNILDDYTLRS